MSWPLRTRHALLIKAHKSFSGEITAATSSCSSVFSRYVRSFLTTRMSKESHPYRAQRVTSLARLPHFDKSPGDSCHRESDRCKLRKGYSILRSLEWTRVVPNTSQSGRWACRRRFDHLTSRHTRYRAMKEDNPNRLTQQNKHGFVRAGFCGRFCCQVYATAGSPFCSQPVEISD